MPSGLHIRLLFGVATVLWMLVLLARGESVHASLLTPFPIVIVLTTGVLFIFDRYLWKWAVFRGWLVKRSNLNGTWRGKLRSSWTNPETGKRSEPIELYLVIRQSYWDLSIRVLSEESESQWKVAQLVRASDGVEDLIGVYFNEPRMLVRHRSPNHDGAVRLKVVGADELHGHYWTSRNTGGEIHLDERLPLQAHAFQDARTLFLARSVR